jgi:riboflavin kinase/FMN adenylyltransferase
LGTVLAAAMQLIRRLDSPPVRDCVLTIGAFDGIHRGHQALIERLLAHAARLGLPPVLLSFEPLPREFLQAQQPPARLTNLRERWRLLQERGIERLCLLRFGPALRSLTATQFMERLQSARARLVVVGHDFHFGRGGQADAHWCAERAAHYGFSVDVVDPVLIDGERASSGGVRAALASGDFAHARRLLGRAYTMRGRVRGGARLGRQLGFPTANLAVKRRRVALDGVFAVRASEAGGLSSWPGVANLGTRPMAGGGPWLLEVHLFDFAGDLYGRELEVEFVARLRAEQRFESMEAMVQQMQRDAAAARTALGV